MRRHLQRCTMLLWTIITFAANAYCLQIENHSNLTQEEITTLFPTNKTISNILQIKNAQNGAVEKPIHLKSDSATWKLDTAYAASNLTEDNIVNYTESRENNKVEKEKQFKPNFRPSVHLGSIEEELGQPTESTGSFTPVIKNPPSTFKSSPKEQYYKTPSNELFKNLNNFPYKFESPIFTKATVNWKSPNLESNPTEEVPTNIPADGFHQAPAKIPAGALYQVPVKIPTSGFYQSLTEPFQEKPDYGLRFNVPIKDEVKQNQVEKRANPWQSVIHLVTTLIPVGLIASALSPQLINIAETAPNTIRPEWNLYRRADVTGAGAGAADTAAPISERCRRRLLCELRSEKLYQKHETRSSATPKCYRIYCEDPEGVAAALEFLLAYHKYKF